jgi:hypothetical protein
MLAALFLWRGAGQNPCRSFGGNNIDDIMLRCSNKRFYAKKNTRCATIASLLATSPHRPRCFVDKPSGGEDNNGRCWATSHKRAAAAAANDNNDAAGETISVGGGAAPSLSTKSPPRFRRLPRERGRRQRRQGQRTVTVIEPHRRRCARRGRERRTGRLVANTTREWCKSHSGR